MIEIFLNGLAGSSPLLLAMLLVAWRFDRRLLRIEARLKIPSED